MSLINKALKEAAEERPGNAAPAACPPLMSADCPPRPAHLNVPLAALTTVVLMLSVFMAWKWFHADNTEMIARARSTDPAANSVSQPQPPPQPSQPVPVVAPEETNTVTAPEKTVSEEKPAATETITNVVAPVEPPKPLPVVYKLQGILFQPGHSTAVINGKTVAAGEHVDKALVVKVDKETVTLTTPAGDTKTLQLP